MSILRELIPSPDAVRTEMCIVDAPVVTAYEAAITTDFLDAVRKNLAVRFLFGARALAERAAAWVRRERFSEPPAPATLRLTDLAWRGDWVRLGTKPPTEFAFGVIGRFWAGETRWLQIDGGAFGSFALPGFARIGCHITATPMSDGRTLLIYEARTAGTDPESTRAFRRYWWAIAPFVGYIMRATLAVIGRNAEAKTRLRRRTMAWTAPRPILARSRQSGSIR